MIRIWTIYNVICYNIPFYINRQTLWVLLNELENLFVKSGTRCIRNNSNIVTACKRSFGQGNIFTSLCVSHSVYRGCRPWVGASLVGCHSWGGCYEGGAVTGCFEGGTVKALPPVNKRAVHILLECFLVINQSSFLRKIQVFAILELIASRTQCISFNTDIYKIHGSSAGTSVNLD